MSKKNELPAWDLSDLYKGIKDPQIKKDLAEYKKKASDFAKKYKGKLASLDAKKMYNALVEYEHLDTLGTILGEFAYLNMCTQMKNGEAMAFYQNTSEALTEYAKPLVFFTLEINQLSDKKIKEWLKDEKVSFYKPWFERVLRFKKHELSEEVEEVLLEKSVTSSAAWVRLYEEQSSRLKFVIDGKEYNDAEISKLLQDKDAKVREKAGKELNRVSKENSPLFTFIYNMVIKDKSIEDNKRKYKKPVSERNLSENVTDDVVYALANTVKENYKNAEQKMNILKAEGKDKTATYRQLMGNKLQLKNMLSLYRLYDLLDD